MALCRANKVTGATGLEPATSGVTGQFEGRRLGNDGYRIPLFMQSFRAFPELPA